MEKTSCLTFDKNHFSDFDQLAAAFPVPSCDTLKLDSGLFGANLSILSAPEFSLVKTALNNRLKYTLLTPADRITFSISASESAPALRVNGIQLTDKTLSIYPSERETSGITLPGAEIYDFQISLSMLHEKQERLEIVKEQTSPKKNFSHCEVSRKNLNEIRCLIKILFDRIDGLPLDASTALFIEEAREEITEKFICLSCNGLAEKLPPPWLRRRVVQKSIEFLDSCRSFPVSIPDICKQVGASERTMRYAFADYFGVSPKQYLQAFRLNCARRQLQRANSENYKVIDIAQNWGFSHMGKFAADYNRLFGEYPSETLSTGRLSLK
jgi:AraC family ethanolamine operon transcriptional activator